MLMSSKEAVLVVQVLSFSAQKSCSWIQCQWRPVGIESGCVGKRLQLITQNTQSLFAI